MPRIIASTASSMRPTTLIRNIMRQVIMKFTASMMITSDAIRKSFPPTPSLVLLAT